MMIAAEMTGVAMIATRTAVRLGRIMVRPVDRITAGMPVADLIAARRTTPIVVPVVRLDTRPVAGQVARRITWPIVVLAARRATMPVADRKHRVEKARVLAVRLLLLAPSVAAEIWKPALRVWNVSSMKRFARCGPIVVPAAHGPMLHAVPAVLGLMRNVGLPRTASGAALLAPALVGTVPKAVPRLADLLVDRGFKVAPAVRGPVALVLAAPARVVLVPVVLAASAPPQMTM